MARKRDLSPSFFKNEELASLDPLARLLFQGLWCFADRNGNLEHRPMRIKAEIFPYEATVQDVEKWIQQLADKLLISCYEVAGKRYVNVTNFLKYQSPHPGEKALYPQPVDTKDDQASNLPATCQQLASNLPAAYQQRSYSLTLSPLTPSPGEPEKKPVVQEEFLCDAVEAIFPGYASNRAVVEDLVKLAMSLKAKPSDIRAFPEWLARTNPKKSFGPYAFRDLFSLSLSGNGHSGNPPLLEYKCARCRDLKIIAVDGKPSDCPNCANEETHARRTA